jgi:hypothetical protein
MKLMVIGSMVIRAQDLLRIEVASLKTGRPEHEVLRWRPRKRFSVWLFSVPYTFQRVKETIASTEKTTCTTSFYVLTGNVPHARYVKDQTHEECTTLVRRVKSEWEAVNTEAPAES